MIDSYLSEKKRLLNILHDIEARISEIAKNFELDLDEVLEKVRVAIENLKNEKFTIAFFGAFSDGKSSILSALTQRLDIKISPEPTTDKITEYPYGDCLIIDTPGLFSEHDMHDEKTKKFISEANVVLFITSSVNPLKESHHATIKWLLSDLDKAYSTIFVINKMDEVADIEDNDDFIHHCKIKKNVIIDTLSGILGCESNPKVVCVSADPHGQGLGFWLKEENRERYYECSHIKELNMLVDDFIQNSKDALINKAGISMIKDSISRTTNELSDSLPELEKRSKILDNQIQELENKLNLSKKEISETYNNIKEEILSYRANLLNGIAAATDIDALRSFYDREIGESCHILNERINLIINKNISRVAESNIRIVSEMEKSIEFHDKMQNELLKLLAKAGSKVGQKIAATSKSELIKKLFEIRRSSEILKKLLKFPNGGTAMKWASKWASGLQTLGKGLGWLTVGIDVLTTIKKIINEAEFNEKKEQLKNDISTLFKDLLEDFTYDTFETDYFPHLKDIESLIEDNKNSQKSIVEGISAINYSLKYFSDILKDIERNVKCAYV